MSDVRARVDVGKRELFASLHEGQPHAPSREVARRGPFLNTSVGLDHLVRWVEARVPLAEVHVVMEATNVYWEHCASTFHERGCTVSVVNPAQIKYFARSVLQRGKTDAMDADLIARYGLVMQPSAWIPPSAVLTELKQLVRERESVVLRLTQERNHLLALRDARVASPVALRLSEARVALLGEQLQTLEHALHEVVNTDVKLSEQTKLLLTVPGFGWISAATVLAETEAFEHLASGREVSAFSGMAPSPNQSGGKHGRESISKTGNARLRRIAYLSALGARRSYSRLRTFYEGLRARGKPPKVALVALGRTLLRIGWAVVKSGVPYRDDVERYRPQDGLGPTPALPTTP